MNAWLVQHLAALRDAIRRLSASPLNSALSLLVIGIALTLPTAGWVVIENLRDATQGASGSQQISLFLVADAGKREIGEIESRLRAAKVGAWRFVPRDEALKRMQAIEGMAEVIVSLPRNPLPDAFVVEPADARPESLEMLAQAFSGWPKVAHVQLDSAWVKRFDAFLRIGKRVVTLLALLFAGALVAVTFNTIRLQIVAQAAEIEVSKLIGATDAFIRRPFQYYGALQGALGGLLAALFVVLGGAFLAVPVAELATLYGGNFALHGLSAGDTTTLTVAGAALGWLGAQISVSIHLHRIG